jgi:hypothetical protein
MEQNFKNSILFLDFDGVLHPEPCHRSEELFCHVPRLEDILRDFPNVEVVITSTWREKYDLATLRAHFSKDIAARIIGVTPDWRALDHLPSSLMPYPRHMEIEAWLRKYKNTWTLWVAIDDRHWLFKPFLSNLIRCDPARGIDADIERNLREKLQMQK